MIDGFDKGQGINGSEVAHYIQALQDENRNVRVMAADALNVMAITGCALPRNNAYRSAAPALIKALEDMDEGVRCSAGFALAHMGEASAVPALILALTDRHKTIRRMAVYALGEIGHISALPALIKALNDRDEEVRVRAVEGLIHHGTIALPALIPKLKDRSSSIRSSAAHALGRIRDAPVAVVAPVLIEALKDRSWEVRMTLLHALGDLGDVSVVPVLLKALKDKHPTVRYNVAPALQMIGDAETLPRKIVATAQFASHEKIRLLDTLRSVHDYQFDEVRTLCQSLLKDENADVRSGAQTVLAWLDECQQIDASARDATTRSQHRTLLERLFGKK